MTAISARSLWLAHLRYCTRCPTNRCPLGDEIAGSLWLAHLRYCTRCPTNRCPVGDEIAADVRETLAPGEHWQGIYRPRETEHGPAPGRQSET